MAGLQQACGGHVQRSIHVLENIVIPKKTGKEFVWTDDEVELLLNVANDYKTTKAADCVDWESVKSKYVDIFELFKGELPDDDQERDLLNDFPHKKAEVTKQVVTSKLKAIRLKYRQAVDSGRRSGHGRAVLIFYELCENVWGGSPATEQIEGGLESADLGGNVEMSNTQDTGESEGNMCDEDDGEDNAEISGESSRGTSGKSSRESNKRDQ